jgi:hypothetical protein
MVPGFLFPRQKILWMRKEKETLIPVFFWRMSYKLFSMPLQLKRKDFLEY